MADDDMAEAEVDQHVVLVQRLHTQTVEGKLEWAAAKEENVVEAALGGYFVRLSTRPSTAPGVTDESRDVILQIADVSGTVLEELTDADLAKQFAFDDAYRVLSDIHARALRMVKGTDKALKAILEALE